MVGGIILCFKCCFPCSVWFYVRYEFDSREKWCPLVIGGGGGGGDLFTSIKVMNLSTFETKNFLVKNLKLIQVSFENEPIFDQN